MMQGFSSYINGTAAGTKSPALKFLQYAILTVLSYIVLPSRSGSRTLGIKDTSIRLD